MAPGNNCPGSRGAPDAALIVEGTPMTNANRGQLAWGVLLLILGGYLLADTLNLVPELDEILWSYILAGLALLLVVVWIISGVENWALLLPAAAMAAGAVAIWLERGEVASNLTGSLVMILISVPFWAGALARRQAGLAIPGWILLAIGLVLLLEGRVAENVFGALILFAVALPFLVIYLSRREQRWPLIPFFILAVLGLVTILTETWRGEYIGALILFAIAVPFYVVYFSNRAQWWPLIPAYILTVVGIVTLISPWIRGEYIGALMMFAIGLPFLVVYLRNREQWWALIPGGVMVTIGLIILLTAVLTVGAAADRIIAAVLFAGLALVFFLIWRRPQEKVGWALYPAIGLAAAAVLVLILGPGFDQAWPVIIIALGLWLLLRAGPALPKT
jgi:hypothetical protein